MQNATNQQQIADTEEQVKSSSRYVIKSGVTKKRKAAEHTETRKQLAVTLTKLQNTK